MQTHALDPPILSRDLLSKRQNQFLTIIQIPIPVFMMILPVAEMGEMANHGGSAAAMVKKGRWNRKINDTYGSGNSIFVFCACAGGGWRLARGARSNPTKFLCRNEKFCTGQIFVPFLGTKKNAMHFTSNMFTMLTVSHVNASPNAPSQSKWWLIWLGTVLSST